MSTENAKKDNTTSEPSPYIYSGQKLQKHSIFTKTAEDLPYFQINKRAQELDINKVPRKWVIRNCDVYREEYQACKSIKGRLHQYYVDGASHDCNQWYENFKDCHIIEDPRPNLSEETRVDAANRIVEREAIRMIKRLSGTVNNDVWERRTEPPQDWNKPLPPELAEKAENSVFKRYENDDGYLQSESVTKLKIVERGLKDARNGCIIL